MSTYSYTISVDFGGTTPDYSQLQREITADGGIAPAVTKINASGDDVDIVFASALSAGEQTTLNGLVTAHTPVPVYGTQTPQFDALVAADGSGDYLKPSAAFAAGATTVYVRAGTYVETSDINIPNYGVMVGETVAPVIIYFVGAVGIKVDGSGGTKETAGTISATNATTAVTGTGTTFTNLSAGQYILLDQNFYEIASITDNTNLVLSDTYRGLSLTNQTYVAQAMHTGVNLSNLIITNSSGTGLYMRAVRSTIVNCCGLMINNLGMEMVDSSTNSMTSVNCFNNTSHGMCFKDCYSVGLVNGETYNNGGDGVHIMGASGNIIFNGVLIANNTLDGINIQGTTSKILVNDCTIQRNAGKGINTISGTGSAVIDGSLMSHNGTDGVDFNGTNNIVSNCIISYNGARGIHAGTNGTITGNHVFNNTTIGIDMTGDSDCQVTGNNIHDNTTDGIYMDGDRNGISDNSLRSNGSEGIHISTGVDNDIDGNNISNNTAEGIKLTGACTGTILANNRIDNNTVGIDIPATADDCVVNGNVVTGNSSHGISVAANDCIITACRCKGNTGDGCIIQTGATNNTVKVNRFTGNTGADVTDNGTTTIKDF